MEMMLPLCFTINTAMQQASLLTADYLDILYTDRNKAYGSYELRKHYNQRAGKALGAMLALCVLIAGYAALPQKKEPVIAQIETSHPHELSPITPQPIPEIPKPEPPVASAPQDVATAAFANPKIVDDDVKIENPLSEIDSLENAIISDVTRAGDATNSDKAFSSTTATSGAIGGKTITSPPADASIPTYVPEMPSFNGNLMEYLGKNLRYPEAARDADIEGRVVVQFIVDENGRISNAKVIRGIGAGCDEEALRVVYKMPRWKAGRQNDKPTKVMLTLPIIFQLQ